MSKKRQDLELELRKLDIDRRDVDVRIRSIEQSPRNQRILKGDFSRPPPREGDTRRFRGRGFTDEGPSKRPRTEGEEGKEEAEAGEKEEKAEGEEESTPAVSSAVVVNNEEPEAKEEGAKPGRVKRKLPANAENEKRDKRIFSSMLMGHLNKAQNRLKVDRTDANVKKKEELEAKVNEKINQRTVGILEKEAEHLAKQRDQGKQLREEIMRKEEAKRRELDELIVIEHEELLGNFIRTQTEPFVYYLPASHTEKTKKLLTKTKEMHDARIADGSVMQEKDLDEGFITDLFKPQENNAEKAEGEKEDKDGDKEGEKERTKEKSSSKERAKKDSSSKKSRKKKDESSSSSSSSDSD